VRQLILDYRRVHRNLPMHDLLCQTPRQLKHLLLRLALKTGAVPFPLLQRLCPHLLKLLKLFCLLLKCLGPSLLFAGLKTRVVAALISLVIPALIRPLHKLARALFGLLDDLVRLRLRFLLQALGLAPQIAQIQHNRILRCLLRVVALNESH